MDLAVRAMAASGPPVPAIGAVGLDAFLSALSEVIEPMHVPGIGVRITSELGWVSPNRATPH